MIVLSDSSVTFPGLRLGPVNSSAKLLDRYRALPSTLTSFFAAIVAVVLAAISGFLGAVAAAYLYDHARSKGDDITVGLGGFFGVGTFVFVVLFTWLQKLHHLISSRTPQFAFYACLVLPVMFTIAASSDIGSEYSTLVLGSWLAILILGLLSLLLCRRWCQREEHGF